MAAKKKLLKKQKKKAAKAATEPAVPVGIANAIIATLDAWADFLEQRGELESASDLDTASQRLSTRYQRFTS